MQNRRLFAGLATLGLVLSACNAGGTPTTAPTTGPAGSQPAPATAGPTEDANAWPDKLVIGFVPSSEAGALVEDIKPLADYLSAQLGIDVEGFVSNDYTGLVTAMQTGQAQIGALPPYGLVQAVDKAGAEVILQSERFGSGTYHTQFFTNNPDKYCTVSPPAENIRVIKDQNVTFLNCNGTARENSDTPEGPVGIEALKNLTPGTTVSFVEETSASGYIFPATVLINSGIDPETAIKPLFAGSHDASVIAVCEGQAEVGVSFDDARTVATTDCDLKNKVVVFAYGPEIPNDGVAVAGSLPSSLKLAIKAALQAYAETEDGAKVLDSIYQITAFTDPNLDALNLVRDAVAKLGYGG
ncbi:MAG TPA: phosphate/phosphite/phosphonate ABC transporter substrate-binding protein [Candidatus Limnocylindrales bacterium]|nr:phosphate/phosphite/phosphonate ABC transporter substrate-binding protein [Candidatus Limnocylindrales bacterium]